MKFAYIKSRRLVCFDLSSKMGHSFKHNMPPPNTVDN